MKNVYFLLLSFLSLNIANSQYNYKKPIYHFGTASCLNITIPSKKYEYINRLALYYIENHQTPVGNFIYDYDNNKRLIQVTIEDWVWGERSRRRNKYTYNKNGDCIKEINGYLQFWDYYWFYNLRKTYDHDSNRNCIEVICDTMFWRDSEWLNYRKETSTFDTNGNRLIESWQRWENEQWIYDYMNTYSYDTSGYCLSEIRQEWDSTKWINVSKNIYIYNDKGYCKSEKNKIWNNNEWLDTLITKYTYTYDDNGRVIKYLVEKWENEQWVYDWKFMYDYESLISTLIATSEKWEKGQWRLKNNNIFILKGSKGNNYGIFYGYRIEVDWVEASSIEGFSDNILSTAPFPNPFTNSTTISYSLENPAPVSINVFDNLGNNILTIIKEMQTAGGHREPINLENHPPGMYFYTIQTGPETESGKLILVK